MISVGSKELKNRLGKYLSLVRQGQAIEITDRGEPVACIIPAGKAGDRVETERLARLIAGGAVRPGRGGRIGLHKPAIFRKGKSSTAMIAEDRR